MEYLFSYSISCTNAFFTIFLHPATLVKWACIQRNWYNVAVSGNSTNIYSKTYRSRILTTYLPIMKNERYKPSEIY